MKQIERFSFLILKLLILTYIVTVPLFWTMGLTTFHDAKATLIQILAFYSLLAALGAIGRFRANKLHLYAFSYLVLSIAVSIGSINFYESCTVIVLEASVITMFILISGFSLAGEIKKWIAAIASVFFISATYGCWQKLMNTLSLTTYSGSQDPFWRNWRIVDAVTTIGNRNFAAEYMVLSLFLFFLGMLLAKRLSIRILSGICYFTGVVYVLITKCRAAWVALGVAVIFMLFDSRKFIFYMLRTNVKKVTAFSAVVLFFLAIILSISTIRNEIGTIFSFRFHTNQFRLLVWKSSLKMMIEDPIFGKGTGSFKFWYPLYRSRTEYRISGTDSWVKKAHNDYVQILVERGLAGMTLFLVFSGIIFYRLHNYSAEDAPEFTGNRPIITAGLLYGLLTGYVMAFLSSNFTMGTSLAYVYLFLGISALIVKKDSDLLAEPVVSKYTFNVAAILMLMWFTPVISILKFYLGQHYYTIGSRFESRFDIQSKEEAEKLFEKSEQYLSCNIEAYFKYGKVLFEFADKLNKENFALERKAYELTQQKPQGFMQQVQEIRKRQDANKIVMKDYYGKSLRAYQRSIELYPNFRNAYNNLGNVFKEIGDVEQALACYKKGIEIGPEYALATCNLAVVYAMKDDNENAEREFKRAIQQDPYFGAAYRNLGVLYLYKFQRPEPALICLERYLRYAGQESLQDADYIKSEMQRIYQRLEQKKKEMYNLLKKI